MGWLIAGIIGIAVGTAVKIVGSVQQAQAQAAADELKAEEAELRAEQLEELSKPGGYYDQQLAALAKEFADIEADLRAAQQIRAIETLQFIEQAEMAKGAMIAQAGVGALAQAGSVIKRQEAVERTVERGIARMELQMEDVQRGLAMREAQAQAQETFGEFKKESGLEEAEFLRRTGRLLESEAEWLSTWGIALGVGTAVAEGVTAFAGLDFSPFARKPVAPPSTSSSQSSFIASFTP